jgi:hypothetical protein
MITKRWRKKLRLTHKNINRVLIMLIIIAAILYIVKPSFFGFAFFEKKAQSDFDNGTYYQTFYNTTVEAVQLNASFLFGTYMSEVFDAGGNASWDTIGWVTNGLGGINMAVRSCDDPACNGENFGDVGLGPYQPLNVQSNQYFQYNISFERANISYSPSLYNVTLNYTIIVPGVSCCCSVKLSSSPKLARQGEMVILTADVPNLLTGEPAQASNISSINLTIYRVEGVSSYTIVDNIPMSYLVDGIWSYQFIIGNNASGNHIASVNMVTNQALPHNRKATTTFSIGKRGSGFSITGVSPDLINSDQTVQLAAELKSNGIPVNSSLIEDATLDVQKVNGSIQSHSLNDSLQLQDGLIYLMGSFNETGAYFLNWKARYNGQNISAKEILFIVSWENKIQNITLNQEILDFVRETRESLIGLLSQMENLQQFNEEEVFLVTDSVNTMTKVIDHFEKGDMAQGDAQQQFSNIRQGLKTRTEIMTGSATGQGVGSTKVQPIQSMEDWRTVLFIVLLAIFAVIIAIFVLLLKIINTSSLRGDLRKPVPPRYMKAEMGKRRYEIILGRLKKKFSGDSSSCKKQGKRHYEIILDNIKKRFSEKRKVPVASEKTGKR